MVPTSLSSGWIKKGWIKSDVNPVKHNFLWNRYLELKKKIIVSLVFARRGTECENIQSDLFVKSTKFTKFLARV